MGICHMHHLVWGNEGDKVLWSWIRVLWSWINGRVLLLSNKYMPHPEVPLPMTKLENIRSLTGDLLCLRFKEICASKQPWSDFMAKLNSSEHNIVHKSCMLLSTVTNGKKIPREFQLDALLALSAGQDCLIDAGTGSGKTLCMVLPVLLDPAAVSFVVLSLKRL